MITGPLLAPCDMDLAVRAFMRATPVSRRWEVEDLDWATADADRLTEGQRSAVQFVTIIEDHLPGYFALYQRHFPPDGTVDVPAYLHNRELYRFLIRWGQEEDTHARALTTYQTATGLAEAEQLRGELAVEGRKEFGLPYTSAVQMFAYPLVQEKATQIYYQHLRDVVPEPVLRDVLGRLGRDEARHFSFFASVLTRYLQVYGDQVVEPIREVIADFRMPLADTMRGYWRWALKIADTASYDHTEAYDHLVRVVERAVDTRSDKVDELVRFVRACGTITV
ncbi:acyl-ACP desaturase [Streptomyces sp. TBY4]|uniref:acyl-ACP desaturase n=1 Tax=Streptomyces sp. TBY4 TaxID=2962030 RepID=UPI0020B6E2EA|nr:acyl-ACP desaturase [Streptomyces sp. TBY4]MCP3757260.1 acyl-ACP desaturase [Streptomyces sp. TBY4]